MANLDKRRFLFYSHDTFGLGHIRRSQKIANKLASENHSILIICSSPKANDFTSEPGVEYLKLPGFTKLKTGNYTARNLSMDLKDFTSFRSEIILSAVQNFKPDVLLVDKEPLGVCGELKPSLEHIKTKLKNCYKICGLRDILDSPEKIKTEWEKRGSEEALSGYYDSVFVYGDQSIFDLAEQYKLSETLKNKLKYVGYLIQDQMPKVENKALELLDFGKSYNDKPLVLFTLGGGEDGSDFLEKIASALLLEPKKDVRNLVITGPFLPQNKFNEIKTKLSGLDNTKCLRFTPVIKQVINSAHLVVSMGGYNTFCENLSLKKRPLILPRISPRLEQALRASIFSEIGFCSYIHPDSLTENSLSEKVSELLLDNKLPKINFKINGLENAVDFLKSSTKKEFND